MLNKALLAKCQWKLLAKPASLMGRVIKEKYQSKEGKWRGREKNSSNISSCQGGVISVKNIFWAGLKFKLGHEEKVNFWEDKWLKGGKIKDLQPAVFRLATKLESSVNDNYVRGDIDRKQNRQMS